MTKLLTYILYIMYCDTCNYIRYLKVINTFYIFHNFKTLTPNILNLELLPLINCFKIISWFNNELPISN